MELQYEVESLTMESLCSSNNIIVIVSLNGMIFPFWSYYFIAYCLTFIQMMYNNNN